MDSANVNTILQSAHEEAEKIRAYSDFDLLALVAGGSNGKSSPVKRTVTETQEKAARQPRKAGVRSAPKGAKAAAPDGTKAKPARDGAAQATIRAWMKEHGEAGAGAILAGTKLERGQFNGAMKTLRKNGEVTAHGSGKRDMTYALVGQ
jgi:hypothetical protein